MHGAYHCAVAADDVVDAVCSPSASQGPGSIASDGEGVDYHQDASVRKCNNHYMVTNILLWMPVVLLISAEY